MNKEQKATVVDEVAAQITESDAVLAVDYRGLSVTQAVELRTRLREVDASFRVVKNRLTSRAADKAGAESLKGLLEGPTAFAFVKGDAALAAKALFGFGREHQVLAFKGGTMEGEPLSIEEIESIARLPGRDALQGQFVGVLASPLTGLVRGLGSMIQGLAVQLGQIQEQGLVGGGDDARAATGEGDAAARAEAAGEDAARAQAAEEDVPQAEGSDAAEGEAAEGDAGESEASGEADQSASDEQSNASDEAESKEG